MMFDLNIDISPAHSEPKTASEEASGDRDSDNAISALNFDIFSKLRTTPAPADVVPDNDDDDEVDGGADRPGFVTWQLFPATGAGSSSDTQWLNLSVSGSGSGSHSQSEVKIPPPPQPQPQSQPQQRRSRRGPRSRSSQYRGVTFYRRTGRWESHIWDCGKQVYLGGFDTAFAAARAYDRAAIKFRGVDADINFTVSDYDEDLKQMKNLNKEEFVHALRRQSTGCSRGSSRYRGVALQKAGRLEAPMGQYLGKKAYDKAAVQFSGREVVSSFVPSNYEMKMPVEVNGELGHNLDLNLGMSVSSERPQGIRNVQVYPRPTFYHPTDDKTMMPGSSYGPPNGQILSGQLYSSNHSAIWHGAPVVSTIHAERAVQENQVDTVPSSTFSNWARNMQAGRHGGANQVVPHFRSAASSGFSF